MTMGTGKAAARALMLGGFGCMLLLGVPALRAQAVTAVPTLDLSRYLGTWYELARLPIKAEKNCERDGFVLLAQGEKAGQTQVVTVCRTKKGNLDSRNLTLKRKKNTGDGQLLVSYLFLLSHKRWVLALGTNYEWALVGSPDHKTLWIYSRTKEMEPAVLAQIEAKAAAEGFATDKLVTMPQMGR